MGGVLHETANQKKQNQVKMGTKTNYEKTQSIIQSTEKKKKGMLTSLCLVITVARWLAYFLRVDLA